MRSYLVLLAGVLTVLSSIAHAALGWPAMNAELARAGAGPDLVEGLEAGWLFGSVAMAGFGCVLLSGALRLRRGDLSGRTSILIVAACDVVFGLAACFMRGFNPHFLLFVITGLLAGIPVLVNKKSVQVS